VGVSFVARQLGAIVGPRSSPRRSRVPFRSAWCRRPGRRTTTS